MSDAALTLLTLGVVVVLFVSNVVPVEVAAVGSALALYGLGIVTLTEAFAGFADPAVVLIAALFVVSEGLDATGVTTWLGQAVAERAGSSQRRLLFLLMFLAAVMTAVIGLNGTVAAMLPMAVVVAMRRKVLPSRLLMPLAFAAGAGQLLLLTGSPVNVVISEAARDSSGAPFGFAEFAAVGVPATVGTIAIALLFGERLVPSRRSSITPPDLSGFAETVVENYGLIDMAHLQVRRGSPLIGHPRNVNLLQGYEGIRLVAILDSLTGQPVAEGTIALGDRLTVVGDFVQRGRFAHDYDLEITPIAATGDHTGAILSPRAGAAEIIVPPRSALVGREVSTSDVVAGLVLLGIARQGEDLGSGSVELQVGDALLVRGSWALLEEAAARHDVLVVDHPDLIRRQAVPMSHRSGRALTVLGLMVVALATGLFPPAVTALLAAGAMILLRVVSVEQAYRGINWTTVLLIAGMMPMSTAITNSGAGEMIATQIVNALGDFGPTAIIAGLFVITVVFSQLISNTATALVMIPIGVSAAQQLDVSSRPVLMSLCVGATVAFLTPVATPANMMVMGPAGYRFGDYWKLGLPLAAFFAVIAIFLVPLVWPF